MLAIIALIRTTRYQLANLARWPGMRTMERCVFVRDNLSLLDSCPAILLESLRADIT